MGANEYGVIFVESDRHQALMRADRARRAVAEAPMRHRLRATVSIGLCDLEAATSGDEALRRADAALFWAKEHGRDLCWLYDPTVVRELDQRQRTRELDRSQALVGLRALARAIDAKDPATPGALRARRGAQRTAGAARGWAPDRVALLRDAALLHDVGKIGIPDAILLKDGSLEDDEFALVREHAVLGARIVGDVLESEQIAWIAGHHERPDGSRLPGGAQGRRRARGRRAARARRRVGRDGLRSLLQRADDARRARWPRPTRAPGPSSTSPPSTRSTALAAARRAHAGGGAPAPADGLSRQGAASEP